MKWIHIVSMINIGIVCSYLSLLICHRKMNDLQKSLPNDLQKVYQKIRQKRLFYYLSGLLIAFIIALFYWKFNSHKPIYNRLSITCFLFLVIPIFTYKLIPIKTYFLEYVQDETVKHQWFRVYQCMKYNFTLFFLIGFIVSGILFQLFDQR